MCLNSARRYFSHLKWVSFVPRVSNATRWNINVRHHLYVTCITKQKLEKFFVLLWNYVRMIPPQNKTCSFYVNRRFLSSHNFVINSRDMKAMKLFWVAIYLFFQVNKCFYIEKTSIQPHMHKMWLWTKKRIVSGCKYKYLSQCK